MNSNKNQKDNDLNFAPMNIQDSLKLNTFPAPNISGGPMNAGTMYMCFPTPAINMMNNQMNKDNKSQVSPLTPYPSNIPNIENTQYNNPNANTNNVPSNFSNQYNSPTTNNNNAPGGSSNQFNTPNTNTNNFPSSFSSQSSDLEYPSELNSGDLYSYNKPRLNENYDLDLINPVDILRNFISEDIELSDDCRDDSKENYVDAIFKKIEDNNSMVLATMKAYRIPYPIAKLLIKNIIKLTLEYKGR